MGGIETAFTAAGFTLFVKEKAVGRGNTGKLRHSGLLFEGGGQPSNVNY